MPDEPEVTGLLALAVVDGLAGAGLARYYLFHAIRADLLRRAGRAGEAATAYRAALELCGNATEREFLRGRLESAAGG